MSEPLALFCSMATFYLIGTLAYVGYMATERELLLRAGKGFWVAGFILHSLFLTISILKGGHLPISDTFGGAIFFAWAVVFASYLAALRYRIRVLGAFVLPLVFFLILVASFRIHQRNFFAGSFSVLSLGLHTVFLFLGYATFALAAITALMYLVLERQIKRKWLGRFYRKLPSLELLEEANGRFVTLGMILYSLGILFGLFWSRAAAGCWIGKDPKVILALLTWVLYGSIFLGKRFERLHGRKIMLFSVVYFFWVIFTFIGVRHPTMFTVLHSQ